MQLCGGDAPDHHGHFTSVKLELVASAYCVAEALSEVTQLYPPSKF